MIVTTSAPIIEEISSANGKKNKGQFKKQAGERFRSGYGKLKEAGAFPVIENLLKLNTGTGMGTGSGTATGMVDENLLPPKVDEDLPPKKMSTTTKIVIAVLILGAIGGGIYFYKKSAKGLTASK